jgi:hypothetical protein
MRLTGELGRRVSDLDLTEPELAVLVSQGVGTRATARAAGSSPSSSPSRARRGTGAFATLATLGSFEFRSTTVDLAKDVEQQMMLISGCHLRVE